MSLKLCVLNGFLNGFKGFLMVPFKKAKQIFKWFLNGRIIFKWFLMVF